MIIDYGLYINLLLKNKKKWNKWWFTSKQ